MEGASAATARDSLLVSFIESRQSTAARVDILPAVDQSSQQLAANGSVISRRRAARAPDDHGPDLTFPAAAGHSSTNTTSQFDSVEQRARGPIRAKAVSKHTLI